jgi:putative NADH-flavin reductase
LDVPQHVINRGHEVTAIVRNAAKLDAAKDVKVIEKDVFDLTSDDIKDLDVVVFMSTLLCFI